MWKLAFNEVAGEGEGLMATTGSLPYREYMELHALETQLVIAGKLRPRNQAKVADVRGPVAQAMAALAVLRWQEPYKAIDEQLQREMGKEQTEGAVRAAGA
jgi:hypothetical protein